jgi:flagellar L-ring protein precursor FlgH
MILQLAANMPNRFSQSILGFFRSTSVSFLALTLLLPFWVGATAHASIFPSKTINKITGKGKPTPPEEALTAYIQRVRAQKDAEVHTPGSLWTDQGRLVRLSTDSKAARLHDVLSIIVSESVAASTDGQVKNSRSSSANSGLTGLFGSLGATNRLQNLIGQSSASALSAQGQSATNSSLSTTFGGEVVDVLPNGMLVVQATRQLTFSQQTQLIKLRGLVRPEDVSSQNQVLSTAMTDLEIEVTGKGIINDYTHRQNPLWRFLQNLVVF